MKEISYGNWESVFDALKELSPKTKGISSPRKFKANATITLKFLDNDDARIIYDFKNVKPI